MFESFMVYYLLQVMVLSVWAFITLRKPKQEEVTVAKKESNGPSASEIIKMRSLAKQLEVRK